MVGAGMADIAVTSSQPQLLLSDQFTTLEYAHDFTVP